MNRQSTKRRREDDDDGSVIAMDSIIQIMALSLARLLQC
ncbi:hypothetical protein CASFOL_021935 [Castilleja foliolosa]|uniref:Uncharacterized protein n=1 Tax=Castilleja foliolosa TaxID=1961234 RepID=A0ABD3CY18_9LAMI